jgi:glycine hydroxymethyltransferase
VAKVLEDAGIICNRNEIPFDTRPPAVTSGIRLGTPAVTTRGFGKEEMKQIAGLIVKVIRHVEDQKVIDEVRQEVMQMCQRFPVPGISE